MNKWQIICPVAALLVGGMIALIVAAKGQHRTVITGASLSIANDLITTTNSTRLVRVSPYLTAQLSRLLGSPTHLATVLLGDEPSGGGMACSRLLLTNSTGQRLVIRLREAGGSGMFEVVGFRNLSE
jgi:hypothetical protein